MSGDLRRGDRKAAVGSVVTGGVDWSWSCGGSRGAGNVIRLLKLIMKNRPFTAPPPSLSSADYFLSLAERSDAPTAEGESSF
jgi:hypothetical protein